MDKKSVAKNYRFLAILLSCMVAGALLGWFKPKWGHSIAFLGTVFINMMFCVVVPLVFASIAGSVANMESVHSRKIKVNYHDSTTSFLEGVFAKGDRRLAPVILEAYKRGCYFDGWEECFKYDTWMQVFEDMGIDPKFYCQRAIGLDEVTPWNHMDYGVTHEYLVREYNKALAAQTTQPCNRACHGCGANHLLGGPCFDYSKDLV